MKMRKINSKKNILKDLFEDNPNKVLCVHVINKSYNIPLKKNTIRTYLDILEDEGIIEPLSKGECAYSTYTHKMYRYNDSKKEVDKMIKNETTTEGVFKYLKRNIPLNTTFRTKNIKKKFDKPADVSKVLHNLYRNYENVEKVEKSGKRNIYKFVDNSELKRSKKTKQHSSKSNNYNGTKTGQVIKTISRKDEFCMHSLDKLDFDVSSPISRLKSDGYVEVIRKDTCPYSDTKHSIYKTTKKYNREFKKEQKDEVAYNKPKEVTPTPKIEVIDLEDDDYSEDKVYIEETEDDKMSKKEEMMMDMMSRMLSVMEKIA